MGDHVRRGLTRSLTVKRAVDMFVSVVLLVVLAGPALVVATLILMRMGRPVMFVQERTGLHGRVFRMYKFRTMRPLDPRSDTDTDAVRLTRLGDFLRKTSLDELPELLNVFLGDMSLVGPRPLLPEYLPRYSEQQARRHEVKPGITGWAQINGRNAISWERKFELDVWYVDNWDLLLDFRILGVTLFDVARRRDVSAEGHATMPPFTGLSQPEDIS